MKNQKWLKRVTAVVMCAVLLATSLPVAFSANAEQYNPAPYFTDEAQQDGAAAWLDEEGVLQIRFLAATGRPTHAVWSNNHNETANVKAIKEYVIELSDLGGKLEKHNVNPEILLTKTVPAENAGTGKISAAFSASEIEALGEKFDIVNKRYNIAITAVDEAGWRSLQIHALVWDVPEFYFDMEKFDNLSESSFAMLEMMRFESASGYTGYEQTGDSVDKLERAGQTGAEDVTSGTDSNAYRMRIVKRPGASGQTLDTCESRQTYDFEGADEVWYWLDLSKVELKGLSFRLRANYKRIDWNITNASSNTSQHYGNVVYSTLGTKNNTYPAGEEPYIRVQNENGNWEKIYLNNGTVDLGHFKGYVRIPIEFFCSETATQVTAHNKCFGHQISKGFFESDSSYKNKVNPYYDDEVCIDGKEGHYWDSTNGVTVFTKFVDIDPVGTPVNKALLIQQGKIKGSGIDGLELGTFLAPGIADADINNENNTKRATLEKDASGNWTVKNRDDNNTGYKAIQDIYSAGIAYQDVSEESINHSLFIDNIMFYKTRGNDNAWNEQVLEGVKTTGSKVDIYFNQLTDAQDRVLDAIDKYIGTPSWSDYRGVKHVDDMISALHAVYKKHRGVGVANGYFTTDALAKRAADIGRADSWNNYTTAKKLCGDENLLDGNNSRPDDLVPLLVQSLEQLPDPSQVTSISDALYDAVVKLYQSYVRLNYGQLKMLGNYVATDAAGNEKALYEEEKILSYASILLDQLENNTVTGYKMANYPFIKFNDFENADLGYTAWQLEDDTSFPSDTDYRKTKGLATFATNNRTDTDAIGKNNTVSKYDGAFHIDAGKTYINQNGYKGSQGVTTTFDSSWLNGGVATNGSFYNIIIGKECVDSATFSEHKSHNMSSVKLGDLAKDNDPGSGYSPLADLTNATLPFSLVMYVDFTEFANSDPDFTFMPNIHTVWKGNDVKARPMFSNSTGIGVKDYWKTYYTLNQTTGEWQRTYNNASSYMFTAAPVENAPEGFSSCDLRGYKGYIAIPLTHFKLDTGISSTKLETQAEALNNIYAVQFSITGGNTDGKSFTIDNIGFTYDPSYYGTQARDTDPTYAEVFGAKSSKSTEFENAVAAIDPYDNTTKQERIDAANALYADLADYQKEHVQTVKQAKALLDKYIAGDIPAAAMNVAQLKEAIAKLPSIPKNAVSENPIPAPGFTSNASNPLEAGAVNYAAFGFESKAQAEEIAKLYTDTYKRLSAGDKASLSDDERTTLINAYNAAMRCSGTLETIKDKGTEFADHLKTVYKPYYDNQGTAGEVRHNFIKVEERNAVAALSVNEYEPLPYYAKLGLSDGTLIPAFADMTDGISRFFANVITDESGNITDGGVKVLMDKYTALYNKVKTELDAKNVLSDALVAEVNDAVAEYNDLIPAYKNVFEVYYGTNALTADGKNDASGKYQGIKDTIELFSRYDTAFADGSTEATLALNPENESTASQTLNINYIEELPITTGGAANTYFKIKYDGVLAAGTVLRDYELMMNGVKVPKVAYDAEPIEVTTEMLGEALKNNTYSAANPLKLKFTAKLTSTELFAEQLSDTVTVYQYRPADAEKGETAPVLIGTYKLNVTYTPSEAYTVTIPAEIPIDWGTAETDVSYSVDCVLKDTAKLTVNVEGSGTLTAVSDNSFTMDYTTAGFAPAQFSGVRTGAKPATLPTVNISDEMWNSRPVGEYRDKLTYTVDYTTTP